MDCTQCSAKYKNLLICTGIKVNHVSTTISPTPPLPAPEYSLRYALIYYVVSVLAPYCLTFSENQLHKCQPGHRRRVGCRTASKDQTLGQCIQTDLTVRHPTIWEDLPQDRQVCLSPSSSLHPSLHSLGQRFLLQIKLFAVWLHRCPANLTLLAFEESLRE